jgi:hypothetical protein
MAYKMVWKNFELGLVKYPRQKTQNFVKMQFYEISNSFLLKKVNIILKEIFFHNRTLQLIEVHSSSLPRLWFHTSCNGYYFVPPCWDIFTWSKPLFIGWHEPAFISPEMGLARQYCYIPTSLLYSFQWYKLGVYGGGGAYTRAADGGANFFPWTVGLLIDRASTISLTSEWHFVKIFFLKISLETNLE